MSICSYEIDEILNESIMTETPSVIVEGTDDVKIYSDIIQSIGKDYEVYAIENIEGYSEGCSGVLRALDDIRAVPSTNDIFPKHMLFIIDRDARFFRGELPGESDGLLLLRYYSIESHYAAMCTFRDLLGRMTSATGNLIEKFDFPNFIDEFFEDTQELYYCSLEALRNACEEDYEAEVGYKYKYGRIKGEDLYSKIVSKKADLEVFAAKFGLVHNRDSVRLVVKGKWLFDKFVESLKVKINSLPTLCREGKIEKCQFCRVGKTDKCLYKTRASFNLCQTKAIALGLCDLDDITYIKDRLLTMGG